MHINLTNNSSNTQQEFEEITDNDAIIYNECDFSYATLQDIYNKICTEIQHYKINEVSIIESKNLVVVNGGNIEALKADFSDVINFSAVEFRSSDFEFSDVLHMT